MDDLQEALNVEEHFRVAAFSPNSHPKRFLCLAMRNQGRIVVRSMEHYGSATVPYDPYKVKERLTMLEMRGFLVVTDSEHEMWENFPTIHMNRREHSVVTNRDYALDLLVEYKQGGLLQLPDDAGAVVPSPLEYRRLGNTSNSEYVFRQYKPTLHVLLLTILALIHPPFVSHGFVEGFFGTASEKDLAEDRLKTFHRITQKLDMETGLDNDKKYWSNNP